MAANYSKAVNLGSRRTSGGMSQDIPSNVHKYIAYLVEEGRFGLKRKPPRVGEFASGSIDEGTADRFKVQIDYGSKSLLWEVLFNTEHPDIPPDFIFLSDDKFHPKLKALQSWMSWDETDEKALLHSIEELMEEYKSYQMSLIPRDSRVWFECESLIENCSIQRSDIEVYVHSVTSVQGTRPVTISVGLNLNVEAIPPYALPQQEEPEKLLTLLQVRYESIEGGKPEAKIILYQDLRQALMIEDLVFHLPQITSDTCLMDYIPDVQDLLNHAIESMSKSLMKRQEYIQELLNKFSNTVVECESIRYTQITILLEILHFSFLLSVELPFNFPKDRPTVVMRSIYHKNCNDEVYECTVNAPHNPRWSCSVLIEKLKSFITENFREFQKQAVTEGKCLEDLKAYKLQTDDT